MWSHLSQCRVLLVNLPGQAFTTWADGRPLDCQHQAEALDRLLYYLEMTQQLD